MEDSINYRNYTIKIVNDDAPDNPLIEWETDALVAVYYDRSLSLYQHGLAIHHNVINSIEVPVFSRSQIKSDWEAITDALKIFTKRLKYTVQEYTEYDFSTYGTFEDMFNDMVSNVVAELNDREALEVLGELYNLHPDYAAYTGTGTGYSQSCWHEILVVVELKNYRQPDTNTNTPEVNEAATNSAEAIATLYRDWTYNDVYGYTVEDNDNEQIDSCWGFYGEYMSDGYNHMIDQAKAAIDTHIADVGEQLELELGN